VSEKECGQEKRRDDKMVQVSQQVGNLPRVRDSGARSRGGGPGPRAGGRGQQRR
jgi:hypothetical protein